MSREYEQYLGDSVYAYYEDGGICLVTRSCEEHPIYLEPCTFDRLDLYRKWLGEQLKSDYENRKHGA